MIYVVLYLFSMLFIENKATRSKKFMSYLCAQKHTHTSEVMNCTDL